MEDKINKAEMLLIGLGNKTGDFTVDEINTLVNKLGNRNYFIVNTSDNDLRNTDINEKRLVQTAFIKDDEDDIERKQWDFYNKWMAVTLNKKLVIIEVDEGFLNPNIIRWPFERIIMVNQKAFMYRYNDTMPQIPEEIRNRAQSVKMGHKAWLKAFLKEEDYE